MKIKYPKIKNGVYAGLFLLTLKTVLYSSAVIPYNSVVDNILQYAAVICFVFSIMKQGYSTKTLCIYAVITLSSVYSCSRVGEWGMLISVISILAIRKENINNVLHFIYSYELFFVVMNIFLSLVFLPFGGGVTSTYKGETVLTLGFSHRNSLSCFIFNLMLLWIWENYKQINYKKIIVLLCMVAVVFTYVKTKTTAIIMLIVLVMLVLFRRAKGNSKLLCFATATVVPAFTCFFYWLVNNYNNMFTFAVDKLLTYRVQQNAYIFSKYGLSFFGQNISDLNAQWDSVWKLSGRVTFDCLYTYLFVSRGIVWVLIISLVFLLLAIKKNNKVNIFLIAWAFYGISEVAGVNCYQCFPVLLSATLFDEKIKEIIN